MSDVELMLVATVAKEACKDKDSLRDKVVAAMNSAKDHWMVLDRDKQFKGAVTAVYMCCNDEEKERLQKEMAAIRAMNALFYGVPVDFERIEMPEEPVGLTKLWKEAIGETP